MRKGIELLCVVLCLAIGCYAQVTSNVFERVMNVRVHPGTEDDGTATAFTIDVDGREYLITAKHVVANLKDDDAIYVFMNNDWSALRVKIFRCADPVDIAVLVPPRLLTVNFELPSEQSKFYIGQEAYFLGFPYGIRIDATGINGPYPMSVIKGARISGTVALDTQRKAVMILLDGYNNPGFSGGPIVYRDLNQGAVTFKLAGVVARFIPEVVPVMTKHNLKSFSEASKASKAQPWKIQQRVDGTYFEYVDSDTFVALNTGIVQGFLIQPAIDLIRQHPIGPIVKDLPGNQPGN